ncbi:MAG TPA: hypothetical protein VGB37_14645 [Candidatus Lokiarchaeia archaeon]
MQYDELDLFILKKIIEKGDVSTHEIAKEFKWGDKNKFENSNDYKNYYSSKDTKINSRLKNMAKEEIVVIEKKERKNNFIVIKEKVKPCLMIKEKDGKFIILEL